MPTPTPALRPNVMPDIVDQDVQESMHEYTALLRSYDLRLHDPDSLVLPLLAGMIARLIDVQHSDFERAGDAPDHPLPVTREIVRAAEAGKLTLSAEARALLRPLILIGAKQLPALMSTAFALGELQVRALGPSGAAPRYRRLLQEERVNPTLAAIIACRLAEDRMPRHPYPLLVAANADLRRPLEQHLANRGIAGASAAALLGAKAFDRTLVGMLRSIAFDYELEAPAR